MTVYFVDPLASGTNDGGGDAADDNPTTTSNWTNAWESVKDAAAGTNGTSPVAGDIIYLKHTNTVDEDFTGVAGLNSALNGNSPSGFIYWITVNSSGVIDGSRYVVEGGDTNTGPLFYVGQYNWVEGVTANNGSANGFGFGQDSIYINCKASNNGGYGFYAAASGVAYIFCEANSNGSYGIRTTGDGGRILFSKAYDTIGDGLWISSGVIYGCLGYDNTSHGLLVGKEATYINSVFDNNTNDNIRVGDNQETGIGIGNRVTESGSYGIRAWSNNKCSIQIASYMPAASEDRDNLSGTYVNMPPHMTWSRLLNNWAGTDADGGYTNPATPDFNLVAAATLRRQAMSIGSF